VNHTAHLNVNGTACIYKFQFLFFRYYGQFFSRYIKYFSCHDSEVFFI
jgi:hypothetical protein